jgi:ribosomal protein S18 acetylase RimI-like enzyme
VLASSNPSPCCPSTTGRGSALLDAVDAEFTRLGVHDQVIGVLPGNVDALRLYERLGFRPTWLYLSRFARAERIP